MTNVNNTLSMPVCPGHQCYEGACTESGLCTGGWQCVAWGEMYAYSLYWCALHDRTRARANRRAVAL